MTKTIALRNDNWDMFVDDYGNIAIKESNDEIAQDVASSVMVWQTECPFDKERGIPYNTPDENRFSLKEYIRKQALRIDGVDEAIISFEKIENRKANVIIYVTNENGDKLTVGENANV